MQCVGNLVGETHASPSSGPRIKELPPRNMRKECHLAWRRSDAEEHNFVKRAS
jgi:hypothetical protein